jgi:hypothetical protein
LAVAWVWKDEVGSPHSSGAEEDQIEIDHPRSIASASYAAQTGFDGEQRMEQLVGRECGESGYDHVEETRGAGRRIDRIGLDDAADSHQPHHTLKLVQRAPQMPAAVAEVGTEGDENGLSGDRR